MRIRLASSAGREAAALKTVLRAVLAESVLLAGEADGKSFATCAALKSARCSSNSGSTIKSCQKTRTNIDKDAAAIIFRVSGVIIVLWPI